jgi:hypothetical protein
MDFRIALDARFTYKSSPRTFPQMTPGSFHRFFNPAPRVKIARFDHHPPLPRSSERSRRGEDHSLRGGSECKRRLIDKTIRRSHDKITAIISATWRDCPGGDPVRAIHS